MQEIEIYRLALKEISKGRGPFKMNPVEHAQSCIEAMKEVAEQALRLQYSPDWVDEVEEKPNEN